MLINIIKYWNRITHDALDIYSLFITIIILSSRSSREEDWLQWISSLLHLLPWKSMWLNCFLFISWFFTSWCYPPKYILILSVQLYLDIVHPNVSWCYPPKYILVLSVKLYLDIVHPTVPWYSPSCILMLSTQLFLDVVHSNMSWCCPPNCLDVVHSNVYWCCPPKCILMLSTRPYLVVHLFLDVAYSAVSWWYPPIKILLFCLQPYFPAIFLATEYSILVAVFTCFSSLFFPFSDICVLFSFHFQLF